MVKTEAYRNLQLASSTSWDEFDDCKLLYSLTEWTSQHLKKESNFGRLFEWTGINALHKATPTHTSPYFFENEVGDAITVNDKCNKSTISILFLSKLNGRE